MVVRLVLLMAACTATAGLRCSTTGSNGTRSETQTGPTSSNQPVTDNDSQPPGADAEAPDGVDTAPDPDPDADVAPGPNDDSAADPGDPANDDGPTMDLLDQIPEDDLLDDTPNADYLADLPLAYLRSRDKVFLTWVADSFSTRQRGLMQVTAEELAPPPESSAADRRAMLFVFDRDTTIGFWMRDTITALDVAYLRTDGTIDSIRTMEPLDETPYPPDGPYRYALEMTAASYAELGLQPGDRVELPARYGDE